MAPFGNDDYLWLVTTQKDLDRWTQPQLRYFCQKYELESDQPLAISSSLHEGRHHRDVVSKI